MSSVTRTLDGGRDGKGSALGSTSREWIPPQGWEEVLGGDCLINNVS